MSTRTRPGRRSTTPRRSTPRRRSRVPGVLLIVAAVLVAGVLLWELTRDGDDATTAQGDPGVAHVHGLGIDPADGALYVATHYGTFRIPEEGPAERVGESFQDTMGFTVIGSRHFLGSGHPDVAGAREGLPGRLGLIESTDAGATWQPVSLLGAADFHGLAYAHDRVYGWDAGTGRFMVSEDRRSWDTRSTADLYSFAVDPADRDRLVAATPGGPALSEDGGKTWQRQPGPQLVVVAWDRASGLWGADAARTVHHAEGPSGSWEEAGALPGPPQALLASGDTLYAAAEEGDRTGIYRSSDGGRTWRLRYRDGAQ